MARIIPINDLKFYKDLRSLLKRPSIRYMTPAEKPSTAFQQKLHNQFLLSSRNLYQQSLAGSTERYARVRDYELMDTSSSICSAALNIYSDNATQMGDDGKVLGIKCDIEDIKKELEILYYDILNVEYNAWHWIRNTGKYGDMFLLLDVARDKGITSFLSLPTIEIDREEGYDNDVNSTRFKWTYNSGMIYDNFQIAHFRIIGDDTFLPYGRSILEPGRRPWKQYNLILDAMLSYRISRAPERRVFYVDIGNIPPDQVEAYMLSIRDKLKRQPLIDSTNGNIDLRYNAVALDDDYFLPVRGDSKTRIDTLPGASNLGDIEDVKLIRSELINALGIPSVYVDDSELGGGRTLGAQQDLQFARSVQRIQKVFLSELTKLGIIHLYAKGININEIPNFSLYMTPPSAILEMQKLEVFDKRFSIFSNGVRDKGISRRWAQKYILNLTNEDIDNIESELESDARLVAKLQSIETGQQTAQAAFGGAGASEVNPTTGSDLPRNPLAPETGGLTDASISTNDIIKNNNDNTLLKLNKKHDYLSRVFSESLKYDRDAKNIVSNLKTKLSEIINNSSDNS